jgi:phenylacetate-CoA ligase
MANDEMTLHCEVDDPHDASGAEAIIGSIAN